MARGEPGRGVRNERRKGSGTHEHMHPAYLFNAKLLRAVHGCPAIGLCMRELFVLALTSMEGIWPSHEACPLWVACGRRLGKNFLTWCSIGRVRSCVRPVCAAVKPLAIMLCADRVQETSADLGLIGRRPANRPANHACATLPSRSHVSVRWQTSVHKDFRGQNFPPSAQKERPRLDRGPSWSRLAQAGVCRGTPGGRCVSDRRVANRYRDSRSRRKN